ncbi:hypothetical protein FIV34_09150 [Luteibacter pinisoli]|uniref:Autotransporter domain-containing protein n=1 Tax=Luteibacter pinisoli TaxID=2589080 RepID=A0A4Y5Z517_9GAMM|nr:hypothetical protein [Luteibacter pinisoli]QDE39358.1 hypothetical protein FIV34_09150 [Luteibacter pinisoli]
MEGSRVRQRVAAAVMAAGSIGEYQLVEARSLGRGDVLVVEGPHGVPDAWDLQQGASLSLLNGARAKFVEIYDGTLRMSSARVDSSDQGIELLSGAIDIAGSTVKANDGIGIYLNHMAGGAPPNTLPTARLSESTVSGTSAGVVIDAGGSLDAFSSHVEGSGTGGTGLILITGTARLMAGTEVHGDGDGVQLRAPGRTTGGGRRELFVEASKINGVNGAAISVERTSNGTEEARVVLRSGAELTSKAGVAIRVGEAAHLDLDAEGSFIRGDVDLSKMASADITLARDTSLLGHIRGQANVTVDHHAAWMAATDSRVATLRLAGGAAGFSDGRTGRRLEVDGAFVAAGGEVFLQASPTAATGGTSWTSDKLLIGGDVTATSPVNLVVSLADTPAHTDRNENHLADNNEGASLVQVAGASRPGAFRLKGGYLVAGPYQYELKAFGPGETDESESHLKDAKLNWDYRLVSRTVCETSCGGETGSGEGPEGKPRPAVAPQVASYISTPGAIFAYAEGMFTNLHQRLGEIRDQDFEGKTGGELFARFSGRNQRYSSGRAFSRYGYDYDHTMEAWQFGGSIVGLDGDNGSVRAGWAFDRGRSSIVPHAVDGESVTRLRANGTSAWITWKGGNGLWADWVVSRQRIRGATDTLVGGKGVGRIRATATGFSAAFGWPVQVGAQWSAEPHVQLSTGSVRLKPIEGHDSLNVTFKGHRYVGKTAGVAIARTDELFAPFVRLDVSTTSGNATVAAGASGLAPAARFSSGSNGSEYAVAVGVNAQLTPRLQAFGEGGYRHYLGAGGFQGWTGHVGLRMTL